MENEIYEADYSEKKVPDDGSSAVFETAVKTGFFKTYSEIMRSIPKVIVPQEKKNYEELLLKLDMLAKRKRGKIKGIVDYKNWDAHIYLTMPFLEFVFEDEYELLKDLTFRTNSLTFTVTGDGKIQLSVMIKYFEEISDTDDVISQAVNGNNELINALVQSMEARRKALLDHPFLGKVIKRAAAISGVTPEEFVDKDFETDESDPESRMQILAALLKASKEISGEDE